MTLTRQQEKKLLIALLAVLAALVSYRVLTSEQPRTAPLAYPRGSVATSAVRGGRLSPPEGADPLLVFLSKREEKYPGLVRDLFRMENPVQRPKKTEKPAVTVALPPPVPQKTPEEIAADAARADLSRFRFLGFLTDQESSLFLSKDGELFIVKSGDRVLKNYQVKETGKDFVILFDTITHVEARIELSGSADQAQPK